jgi:pimeloyl-ACP methyl ester carboxylesterase
MTQDLSGLRTPRLEEMTVVAAGRRLAVRRLDPRQPGPWRPDRDPCSDGGNAAPTLVFLHEGLGSIAQWRDFPDALCRRTALPGLVYERWGFGGSEPLELPRPRDYLAQEAELFLPAVLEACDVQRPLLVGHSDGGSIALLYAAAFPDRPHACITEAAHVFVEEAALAGIRAAAEAWRRGDLETRLAKYHGAKTEAVFLGWAETWLRDDFRDWSMVDRLPAIACPLLVMQGAEDEYGTALQVETIVGQAGGPAEPLILPDCGHAPHLEQPEAVLAAMAAFVGRVTARPVPQPP